MTAAEAAPPPSFDDQFGAAATWDEFVSAVVSESAPKERIVNLLKQGGMDCGFWDLGEGTYNALAEHLWLRVGSVVGHDTGEGIGVANGGGKGAGAANGGTTVDRVTAYRLQDATRIVAGEDPDRQEHLLRAKAVGVPHGEPPSDRSSSTPSEEGVALADARHLVEDHKKNAEDHKKALPAKSSLAKLRHPTALFAPSAAKLHQTDKLLKTLGNAPDPLDVDLRKSAHSDVDFYSIKVGVFVVFLIKMLLFGALVVFHMNPESYDLIGLWIFFARSSAFGACLWTALLFLTMSRDFLNWASDRVNSVAKSKTARGGNCWGRCILATAHVLKALLENQKELHIFAAVEVALDGGVHTLMHLLGTLRAFANHTARELNNAFTCARSERGQEIPGYLSANGWLKPFAFPSCPLDESRSHTGETPGYFAPVWSTCGITGRAFCGNSYAICGGFRAIYEGKMQTCLIHEKMIRVPQFF